MAEKINLVQVTMYTSFNMAHKIANNTREFDPIILARRVRDRFQFAVCRRILKGERPVEGSVIRVDEREFL